MKTARAQQPEVAIFKPSRWPGLIWAVPVAAVGIIVWLGVRSWISHGPTVTVDFPVIAGLQADHTKIKYDGYVVGEVSKITFGGTPGHMLVELGFNSGMEGHLGPGTRYWIEGAAPQMSDLSSLVAAISGAYIAIEPRPGKTVAQATGLPSKNWPGPDAVSYVTTFSGASRGLRPGADVQLERTSVGCVTDVRMQYDPTGGELRTRVTYAIEPHQIQLTQGAWERGAPREQMDRMIGRLIDRGLRAQLGEAVPVVGSAIVELRLRPKATKAHLMAGNPPQIPAGAETGGIMDQLPDILDNVQRTAAELTDALKQAQTVLNAQSPGNAGLGTTDLPHTLEEVSKAAKSVRELTDYLGSHPNAIITGRKSP